VSDPTHSAFRRAILALAGGSCDDRIVRLTADLARTTHSELVGVHVVEIGWSMPLDADVAARSEEAQQILDHAELEAEQLKIKLEPVLLQAREVGAALVDEATERGADLLVLGLPYRKRFGGDFAIGRTIPYVLKHAPCEVWVVREPIPAEPAPVPAAAGGRKEQR
jgi:nucleotide-binding universal stress UspA family protein